jgi:hypothetical protein
MRDARSIVLLVLAVLAAPVHGQDEFRPSNDLTRDESIRPPAMLEGHSNAALAYYRVWDSIDRNEVVTLEEVAQSVKRRIRL